MENSTNYLTVNKQTWNERTKVHLTSDFYANDAFMAGSSSLNSIELGLLGDVKGKRILHLQCHFGQDTISLSRMGAEVTGVDFSDEAIKIAEDQSAKLNTNTRFICCDVYSLPELLNEQFDIVFTSYGTIGWLPDMDRWAKVVQHFLKPGGQFVFVEFHPVVWMFDDDFSKVGYSYFNAETIEETVPGTYADNDSDMVSKTISWNHPLDEVLTALLQNKLTLTTFQEFDYSPYDCFRHTEEIAPKKYRIKHLESKIPMVYALKMIKQ